MVMLRNIKINYGNFQLNTIAMKAYLSILFLFILRWSDAQLIQWASELEFVFKQYEEDQWSGKETLGPPDAFPHGTLNPNAYRLSKEAMYGTVVVKYDKPQQISQILIVESNEPGRIVEVALVDTNNEKHVVFSGTPTELPERHRVLFVNTGRTEYKVSKIELNVNTIPSPGWAQIDAIGMADSPNEQLLKEELKKYGVMNMQEEKSFVSDKESLGKKVNTPYTENKPIIAPDGKTLWFCRQNFPGNVKGEKDEQDIYYSTFINGKWTEPQNAGYPLNNKFANGVSAVSPDGNTLLLINEYGPNSVKTGLSISHKTSSGWGFPKPLEIADYYNNSIYADHYLANNGKVLLLAVERNDGLGDQDLFVCFSEDGEVWGPPVNLGRTINTEKAEFSPFLAADDKTLYFASEGHNGLGKSDIFYSKRLDDTWQNWSKPKNIGTAVNTSGWDAYYSVSAAGDYAYFISTKGSVQGSKDIYRIALPDEFKPDPVLLITGNVYNAKTGEKLDAKIVFESLATGKQEGIARANPVDGSYKIVLPRGKKYGYWAKAKGYVSISEHIDLSDINEYQEIKKDLYLMPIEEGQLFTMNNLFFEQSLASLRQESFPELDRLLSFLEENPTVSIELRGHTDNQGPSKLNYDLSQNRVETIKSYLTDKGILGERISLKAFGPSKPIASNASEETRRLNRRVEIMITDE